MAYTFTACGHPKILGTHKNTLEFTKDKEVSLKGDCIIGVNANFDLSEIKNFIESLKSRKISIAIKTVSKSESASIEEGIFAEINTDFDSAKELVIRKTDFISERTFGIRADKSAFDLDRKLIDFLKSKEGKISVIIDKKFF